MAFVLDEIALNMAQSFWSLDVIGVSFIKTPTNWSMTVFFSVKYYVIQVERTRYLKT